MKPYRSPFKNPPSADILNLPAFILIPCLVALAAFAWWGHDAGLLVLFLGVVAGFVLQLTVGTTTRSRDAETPDR